MSEPHWNTVKEYVDITYKKADGVARIAINRPEVRNAFRPETLLELQEAFKMQVRILKLVLCYLPVKDLQRMASMHFVQGAIKR